MIYSNFFVEFQCMVQGWLFAVAKSKFARTVEKTGKNRQKAVCTTGLTGMMMICSARSLNQLNLKP
jgi:hypothetical protein